MQYAVFGGKMPKYLGSINGDSAMDAIKRMRAKGKRENKRFHTVTSMYAVPANEAGPMGLTRLINS